MCVASREWITNLTRSEETDQLYHHVPEVESKVSIGVKRNKECHAMVHGSSIKPELPSSY